MEEFLKIGKITNVHGLMGDVRVEVWADSPDFFKQFSTLYVGKSQFPIKLLSSRAHKKMAILKLEGLTDVNSALTLRGQELFCKREDVTLPEGHFFLADLVGLDVLDVETEEVIGKIHEVLTLPAHNVYVVKGGKRDVYIPAVPTFIKETNIAEGFVKVFMMEGL
ncbi:MAG: ribosome maturation factor RimM [Eubacteriales bacterium]